MTVDSGWLRQTLIWAENGEAKNPGPGTRKSGRARRPPAKYANTTFGETPHESFETDEISESLTDPSTPSPANLDTSSIAPSISPVSLSSQPCLKSPSAGLSPLDRAVLIEIAENNSSDSVLPPCVSDVICNTSLVTRDGNLFQVNGDSYMPTRTSSTAEGHSNLCVYIAVSMGDTKKALRLEKDITPLANTAASERNRVIDFSLPDQNG